MRDNIEYHCKLKCCGKYTAAFLAVHPPASCVNFDAAVKSVVCETEYSTGHFICPLRLGGIMRFLPHGIKRKCERGFTVVKAVLVVLQCEMCLT